MKALGISATGMVWHSKPTLMSSPNRTSPTQKHPVLQRLVRVQDLVYQSFASAGSLTSEEGTAPPVSTEYCLGVNGRVSATTCKAVDPDGKPKWTSPIEGAAISPLNRPDGDTGIHPRWEFPA